MARKTFFTEGLQVSEREGGSPMRAPMDTPRIIIAGIRVCFISGITEVKMPPISRKKIRGTP